MATVLGNDKVHVLPTVLAVISFVVPSTVKPPSVSSIQAIVLPFIPNICPLVPIVEGIVYTLFIFKLGIDTASGNITD